MIYSVGDRVRGMFSEREGVVTQVTPAGVYVHWDGEDQSSMVCYHPDLHVRPVTLAMMHAALQESREKLAVLEAKHARLQAQLDVLEAKKKVVEDAKAEDALAEYKRQQLVEYEKTGRRGL